MFKALHRQKSQRIKTPLAFLYNNLYNMLLFSSLPARPGHTGCAVVSAIAETVSLSCRIDRLLPLMGQAHNGGNAFYRFHQIVFTQADFSLTPI